MSNLKKLVESTMNIYCIQSTVLFIVLKLTSWAAIGSSQKSNHSPYIHDSRRSRYNSTGIFWLKIVAYIIFAPLFFSAPLYAEAKSVDRKKLWLPIKYQYHFNQLEIAAKKVIQEPKCAVLLEGTVLESRSTIKHPVFKFRCRTDTRKTFSLQVDSKTLAVTNHLFKRQQEMLLVKQREEAKQKAQEEAKRKELSRKEEIRFWGICLKALRKKTRLFSGVEVLTTLPPKPDISDAREFTYTVDFDARNARNAPLHFTVVCTIDAIESYQVSVNPRVQ